MWEGEKLIVVVEPLSIRLYTSAPIMDELRIKDVNLLRKVRRREIFYWKLMTHVESENCYDTYKNLKTILLDVK